MEKSDFLLIKGLFGIVHLCEPVETISNTNVKAA